MVTWRMVGNPEVIPPTFAGATPECMHGINTGMHHSHATPVWYIGAMIRHNESVRLTLDPCAPRPSAGPYVPPSLERQIAARWQIWVPWVRMHLLRARQHDPSVNAAIDSPESRRLRQRHREHILDLIRDGISMRTIRRHRLDDPRITDEVRALLVDAVKE